MTAAEAPALSVDEAVPYLLGRGLLTPAEIVAGEVRARSATYRHRHLSIERGSGGGGRGFVVKQIEPSLADADASFRIEELFYRRCRDEPLLAPLAPFVAPPCLIDGDRRLLVFDLLAGARSLDNALAKDAELPAAPHAALGRALGALHRAGAALVRNPGFADLERRRPAIFTLHRPKLASAARISGAQRRLLTILQEHPEIGRGLDAAAQRWVGADDPGATLVHGDVRSKNVLVMPPDAGGEAIRLIDWELLGIGDPAWDVAGALQDLLDLWIRGLPLDPALSGGERVEQAKCPLADFHPLFAAFRASYAAVAGDSVFDRAVPFSAVRLLQTAWEWAQDVAELPAPAVMTLQVGANILADPERARAELYGFAEDGGA